MGAINFDDFSNWGNISNQQVTQSGPSNKNTDGNSMSTQTGNANSLQWGNKNSYQYGVSNSVLVGMSFSTNVAATISTTVGVPFSFQLAGSVSAFLGPKFSLNRSWELSASWASKYTWVKKEPEYELKEEGFELVDKTAKFHNDANEWVRTQNFVAQNVVDTIADEQRRLGARVEAVAASDTKTVAGTHSITATQHEFTSTMGSHIRMGSFISMNGSMLSFAGEVIKLG